MLMAMRTDVVNEDLLGMQQLVQHMTNNYLVYDSIC